MKRWLLFVMGLPMVEGAGLEGLCDAYLCTMRLSQEQIDGLRAYFATKPVLGAYLFGSFARGEADEKSDVDILVDLDRSVPFGLGYFGMIGDLQELLGRPVDVVTREALSPHVEPYVRRDLLPIYARQVPHASGRPVKV